MTDKDRAEVLRMIAFCRTAEPYQIKAEADRLDPLPAPEPEIPIGPGDEGRTPPLGPLLVIHAISACWRMMRRDDGIMFAEPVSNDFIRTKVAVIKRGDPVEIVGGLWNGVCGIVAGIEGNDYHVIVNAGQLQMSRHELRRLKA